MSALLRRLRAARREDRGISLVELAVSMMVMSIIVITTVSLTIAFQRTNAQNVSRQEQIDTARSAVEAMSRTVRAAIKPAQIATSCPSCTEDAFLVGGHTRVQFYANIDNPGNTVGPSRVTYELLTTGPDAGDVVQKIQVPDSATPSATGYSYCNAEAVGASAACKARLSVRPVAFDVLADGTRPIFKYYDSAGNRLDPGSTGLTASQLSKVLAIELVVTVQADNATQAAPTTYIQRITLPNAQAVIRTTEEATP